jgi:hypothetical protein
MRPAKSYRNLFEPRFKIFLSALLRVKARRIVFGRWRARYSRCAVSQSPSAQYASARAFERNVREASRQTGKYPGVVVIDARAVSITAMDAETYTDRAIGLVGPRRPRLQEVIVITDEKIIRRPLVR